jgi:hypothetical protein
MKKDGARIPTMRQVILAPTRGHEEEPVRTVNVRGEICMAFLGHTLDEVFECKAQVTHVLT